MLFPFAISVEPLGMGYQARLVLPDGVILTATGVFSQDAVARLFDNWTPAVNHHLKKAVMASLPAYKVPHHGNHHAARKDNPHEQPSLGDVGSGVG